MNRKLSDEEIDRIAKNLLQNFSPDDEMLDEIADSPKLWWNVRNGIEQEKTRRERNWFFGLRRQLAAFGALGIILFAGIGGVFLNLNSNETIAEVKEIEIQKVEKTAPIIADEPKSIETTETVENKSPLKSVAKTEKVESVSKKELPKNIIQTKSSTNEAKIKPSKTEVSKYEAKTETKTDFIKLSYSSATDSGQIVRVKVPSSMMVSLGVTTESEQQSKFVNAEVVIGDDGMAQAIRFIK